MTDLLAHFKAMQAMAQRYLIPEPYVRKFPNLSPQPAETPQLRADFFISDLINMLDGPEQREAQATAEGQAVELAQAAEWRMDLRTQIAQADSIAKAKHEEGKALRKEVNELRLRLFHSELAYAKLSGYVDRMVDEQPPVMVPQQREPRHAQMPDGSNGTMNTVRHRQPNFGDRSPNWFDRG